MPVGQSTFWLGFLSPGAWHGLWSGGGLGSARVGAVSPSCPGSRSLNAAKQWAAGHYNHRLPSSGGRGDAAFVSAKLPELPPPRLTGGNCLLSPSLAWWAAAQPSLPSSWPSQRRWQPQQLCESEDGTQSWWYALQ